MFASFHCGKVNNVFEEENPESALEEVIDGSLGGSYPMEDVYKVYKYNPNFLRQS